MTDHSTPIPPWAFPGNKVVCIHQLPRGGFGDERNPVKGEVYTIRAVEYCVELSVYGLMLAEIVNPPRLYDNGFRECIFSILHFKPVATTDNEIEAQIYNRNSPRKSLSKKLTSA